MKLIINGQLIQSDFREMGSLNDLKVILNDLYKDNEIVQEVVIDGVTYHEGYDERLSSRFSEIGEVVIRTVNGDILAAEISHDLKNYMPKLINACDSISELFYGELKQEDWDYFNQLMNGIQWVVQSAEVLKAHYSRNTGSVEQSALASFTHQVGEHIHSLEQGLQAQDYTAIGDLIKYELPEVFMQLADSLNREVN